MNIYAQLASFFGTVSNILGINSKNRLKCFIFFTIGNLFVAVSLLLVNAYAGMIVQLVFVVETLINFFLEKGKKHFKYPLWLIAIYIIVPCAINIINFDTCWDLLPMSASILFPLAILSKDTLLRILNLISIVVWIPYNFAFGQYAGTIGCTIFTIMNFVAIYRFDIKK